MIQIPSPYSSERLNIVKQLKRTKKMEVQSWSNVEDTDAAQFSETSKEMKEDTDPLCKTEQP